MLPFKIGEYTDRKIKIGEKYDYTETYYVIATHSGGTSAFPFFFLYEKEKYKCRTKVMNSRISAFMGVIQDMVTTTLSITSRGIVNCRKAEEH